MMESLGLDYTPAFEPTRGYFSEWLHLRKAPIPLGGGKVSPNKVLKSDGWLFDTVYRRWAARTKGDTKLDA